MSYFDKDFYVLTTNFSNLQVRLMREFLFTVLLIITCVILNIYMLIPFVMIFILSDIIVFIVNIYLSDSMYKNNFRNRLKQYERYKADKDDQLYKLNCLIADRELDNISHQEAQKGIDALDQNIEVILYAQTKIKVLDALEKKITLTDKQINDYYEVFRSYSKKTPLITFESARLMRLLKQNDKALEFLNSYEPRKNISSLAYIFYSNVLKSIIYEEENKEAEKEKALNAIKSFYIINRFRTFYNNALENYK